MALLRDAMPCCQEWTEQRLQRLAYSFSEHQAERDTVLQRQGAIAEHVWLISEGEVRVQQAQQGGGGRVLAPRPAHLALCGRGLLLGELRQATAECEFELVVQSARCQLLVLSREQFFSQIERHASLAVEEVFVAQLASWGALTAPPPSPPPIHSPAIAKAHLTARATFAGARNDAVPSPRGRRAGSQTDRGWQRRVEMCDGAALRGALSARSSPRHARSRWDSGTAQFGGLLLPPTVLLAGGEQSESPARASKPLAHSCSRQPAGLPRLPPADTLAASPAALMTGSNACTPTAVAGPWVAYSLPVAVSPRTPRISRRSDAAGRLAAAAMIAERRARLVAELMPRSDVTPPLPPLTRPGEGLTRLDEQVLATVLADPRYYDAFAAFGRLGVVDGLSGRDDHRSLR